MKVPINLASQPFRRDRAMLAASIGVCVLLLGTLGVLAMLTMADRTQLAEARQAVSRLNAQVRQVNAEQARADAVLRKPENAVVLEHTVFLNELLRRKGISWTRIFDDLEKHVPFNVRIIQIHPIVDSQNHVSLDLNVATQTPQPAIDLLKTLENAPFSRPEIKLMQKPTQAEPVYKYRVSVDYAQAL